MSRDKAKIKMLHLLLLGAVIIVIALGGFMYIKKTGKNPGEILSDIRRSVKEGTWKAQLTGMKKRLDETKQKADKDREGAISTMTNIKEELLGLKEKAGNKTSDIGKLVGKADHVIESLRSGAEGVAKKIDDFGRSIDSVFSGSTEEHNKNIY